MYCSECKALIKEKAKYCPLCGRPLGPVSGEILHDYRNGIPAGTTAVRPPVRKMKTRTAAILSYISLLGVFIAYKMVERKDDFVCFHFNQSIIINVAILIFGVLLDGNPFLGLADCILLGCAIYGIYQAYKGTMKGIPYISTIRILKAH